MEVPGVEAVLNGVALAGGEAPPSPAGAVSAEEAAGLPAPPMVSLPRSMQVLRFNQRQIEFVLLELASFG